MYAISIIDNRILNNSKLTIILKGHFDVGKHIKYILRLYFTGVKASKVKKSGRYLLSFIVFIINHLVNYQYLSNRLRGQRFHLPIRSSDQFLRLSKQNRYGRYKK